MKTNQLILPDNWVNYLVNLPETGMGYQSVKVFLKNGIILSKHKVINSSILVLNPNENISLTDIEKIELEN